ncbi:hypothetical protein KSC_002940 [Ktedonobacter sp. SOSP1-52]|uniref:thioester reductase n=1 Tax=Ktedonobacter sp. SOSP1-52 TaxID=2778366 RepID=UPI001A30CF1E|nr:thioester reductase [Ktedonobacter sp. SOSP1-52]GHO61402.1 hypothetical protein KSC_002940 [Ktedonobacter sp. SOSP1-52]
MLHPQTMHTQVPSSPMQSRQQKLLPPHVLLESILTKKEAPLNAVVLQCLPLLQEEEASLLQAWHQGRPALTSIVTTQLGRVGTILLPLENSHGEEQQQQHKVIQQACQAVALARACGARSVALSARLASQTNGGKLIQESQYVRAGHRPRLTTTDATTSAAALLNLEWVLARVARDLCRERVAVVVGPDPLASTCLRLLLATLPHPASLTLCALPDQDTPVEELVAELQASGFQGEMALCEMQGGGEEVPDVMYEATLFFGTSSLLDGLDMTRLRAGTLLFMLAGLSPLVSEPFLARMCTQEDILAPRADELTSSTPMQERRAFEKGSMLDLLVQTGEGGGVLTPYQIHSSLLAGLAVATLDVPSTLGQIDTKTAQGHYFALRRAGFRGTAPYLGMQTSASTYLTQFCARFRTRS